MSYIKVIHNLSSIVPIRLLVDFVSPRCVHLLYHAVGEEEELFYLKGLYDIISPECFRNDLINILTYYNPISLEQLIQYNHTGELPSTGRFFFLSFDDGLRATAEVAVPMLLELGIPATFFINTAFVGNASFLHRFKTNLLMAAFKSDRSGKLEEMTKKFFNEHGILNKNITDVLCNLRHPQKSMIDELIQYLNLDIQKQLKEFRPYMSLTDLIRLKEQGFTIGAHSVSHPEYNLITFEEQLSQTFESVKQIERWLQPEYSVFAFPFTDAGVEKQFFSEIGKYCHIDLSFGCSGIKRDKEKRHLNRIPMDNSGLRAIRRLKFELFYYFLKSFIGRNTYHRK